ncbi:predicted protein [Naegleria gruberi]|uniref:Predicted protein n=1 Tax=Naegleria gruberi TaxID=5762 RepID=D2VJV2_NAEGR|nr:uncharacterized protein NAEGRDRAFT_50146 [Naegleria gruberi]EFC42835.1 predicted protein [Naegleria gruberi]|eukprot:XP_002675579.1 predicted protein [Naegleria gruberi strain NEG-M]
MSDRCGTILQLPVELLRDEIFAKYLECNFIITKCSLVCKNWLQISADCKLIIDVKKNCQSFAKYCQSQRLLNIVGFSSTDNSSLGIFVKYCTDFQRLKSLNLFFCLKECFEHISKFTNLEMLSITQSDFENALWIGNFTQLTYLNLNGNFVGRSGCENIRNCQSIMELNLSNNDLQDDACVYLSELKNLKILLVENNDIGENGCESLSRIETLTKLNISRNHIHDDGFSNICKLSNLTHLHASCCLIGSVSNLTNLNKLIELELSGNLIDNEGVKVISEMQNLRILNLVNSYMHISDDAVHYLTKLVNLELLDLSENSLNIEDIDCLKSLPRLREVKILTRHKYF